MRAHEREDRAGVGTLGDDARDGVAHDGEQPRHLSAAASGKQAHDERDRCRNDQRKAHQDHEVTVP